MKIYKYETAIAEQLKDNKISFSCAIKPITDESVIKDLYNSIADEHKPDTLYWVYSVLVSVGWNKNDDVFLPDEVWQARETPVHKPFNLNHDEGNIIGHIVSSLPMSADGSIADDVPSLVDLAVASVIYKYWRNPLRRRMVESLISEIDASGKWHVSMECIFPDFDYALKKDSTDEVIIVPRNDETSFLTRHLRVFGGSGEYKGYRVGRVLRDIIFNGKGLVERPANPRSIIIKSENSQAFVYSVAEDYSFLDSKEESKMSDVNLEQLTAENKELKEKAEKLQKEFDDKLKSVSEEYQQQLAEVQEKYEETKSAVENLEKENEELKKQVASLQEEKDGLARQAKLETRRSQLVDAGIEFDKAGEIAEEWIDVDDERFKKIVEMHNAMVAKSDDASASDNDNVDDVDMDDSTADDHDEPNLGVDDNVDNTEELMQSVASWIEEEVLAADVDE